MYAYFPVNSGIIMQEFLFIFIIFIYMCVEEWVIAYVGVHAMCVSQDNLQGSGLPCHYIDPRDTIQGLATGNFTHWTILSALEFLLI